MHDTAPTPVRPTQTRWLIFILACATSWLLYLHRYAWGVIRPSLKAENPDLTDQQLGWLDAMFNLTYAIGQVPGGLAGDLGGPRVVLSLLILLWSGCVAWLTAGRSFLQLAGIRAAFGLAQAGAYPCLSQVTRRWFPVEVRTTVQGLVASLSGRAGGACASLIIATLLMGWLGLSWREALVVLASGGILLAGFFWLGFRDSPRAHPWCNQAEANLIVGGTTHAVVAGRPQIRLEWEHAVTLAGLTVYSFATTFADQLYVFWIPQFLEEYKGLSKSQMGLFAGLPLLGGALGGAVGGGLNDLAIRLTGNRRLGRSAVAFTGKFLAAVLITLSLLVADGRWVMVVLFACKFFCDWSLSTVWGTITDIGGPASGTLFGTLNAVGAAAGFLAGPVMGWVKQHHGFDVLFVMVAGMYALAAVCWLAIDSRCRLWREGDTI
jgi:ACS family glucarate transporter-like MFS transporter